MTYPEKIDKIESLATSLGCCAARNEPLFNHTSVKVGGPCDLMLFSSDPLVSARLYYACKADGLYTMILGNGSNCLFSDEGFRGVIIAPQIKCEGIERCKNVITAPAGVLLSSVCRFAMKNALSGMEFAYGIPGTVGGAVYMNAGAYGGDMSCIVSSVTAMDSSGKLISFTPDELELGYRKSRFERTGEVIVSVSVTLRDGDADTIFADMNSIIERRKSRQPLEYPSFGSAFKRPEGTFAGLVIEQSGLKGARVGNAQISPKHANFIINLGGATAADITGLIELTERTVAEKTGCVLEPEVRLIPPEPVK